MTQLRRCPLHIILWSIQILYTQSLSITSLYVIVDPASTSGTLVFELKDHYTDNKQRIGYLNGYLMDVYVKPTGFKSWLRMQNTQQNYMLHSNQTLSTPISLRLTFFEEPYTNYTWDSFLSNFEGTTIYRLYTDKHSPSSTTSTSPPTDSAMNTSTQTSTEIPTQVSINNTELETLYTAISTATATQTSNDEEPTYFVTQPQSDDRIFMFSNSVLVSLGLVSAVCVLMFVCCIGVGCCFYCHFKQRIQSVNTNKRNNETRESIAFTAKHSMVSPKCGKTIAGVIRMDAMERDEEGLDESLEMMHAESSRLHDSTRSDEHIVHCEMDYNDDESNVPLFRNLSSRFKKVASISLNKLSKSNSYDDRKEMEIDPIVLSTESKSRTSISLHPVPFTHTYALNMDQLIQLQHGMTVETGDGIRIKVLPDRKRVFSLIKTYDTNGNGYSSVNQKACDMDDIDEESSSNESLYNYPQTDGGSEITTPTTAVSDITADINGDVDIEQLASLPREEGMIRK